MGFRKRLARLVGLRCEFQAVFIKLGTVNKPHKSKQRYMFLCNIQDEKGRHIAEHVWMPLGKKDVVDVKLREGDVIRFTAEVNIYAKGPLKHRRFDYGLIHPRYVERIDREIGA